MKTVSVRSTSIPLAFPTHILEEVLVFSGASRVLYTYGEPEETLDSYELDLWRPSCAPVNGRRRSTHVVFLSSVSAIL